MKTLLVIAILFVASTLGVRNPGLFPQFKNPHILQGDPTTPKEIPESALTTTTAVVPLSNADDKPAVEVVAGENANFAPGTIVSGNQFFNPLTRVRDAFVNNLLPVLKRPFSRQSVQQNPFEYVTDCTDHAGVVCSDCHTMMLCNRVFEPLYTQKCPASTPFCTINGCSATTKDEECTGTAAFTCTREGYFPDPRNCSLYYYCPWPSALPREILTYICPSGFFYNTFTRNCQRQFLAPKCQSINCKGHEKEFMLYTQNEGYYAYCPENVETGPVIMFKCPDADNQVYNKNTYGCEFKCRQEGFFADTQDCQSYYFCYRDGLFGIKNVRYTCPPTYKYTEGGKCVKTTTPCVNIE